MYKYFSGTATCAFKNNLCALAISGLPFAGTSVVVSPFNKLDLYLNEDELSAVTLSIFPASLRGCSCFLNCHKEPDDS